MTTLLVPASEPPAATLSASFHTCAQNTPMYLGLSQAKAFAAFSAAVHQDLPSTQKHEFKTRTKEQTENHILNNLPPLVVFSDGAIAATALLTNPHHKGALFIDDYPVHMVQGKTFTIGHVARLPQFKNMGFPSMLLNVSETFSAHCGADCLMAKIAETNTGSQNLFKKHGYAKIHTGVDPKDGYKAGFWVKSLETKGYHND